MARRADADARDRARQARIALDKKRAEHMAQVERTSLAYFKALDAMERASEALAKAERDRAVAVQGLNGLGLSNADITDALGLDAKTVRALLKVKIEDAAADQDELPAADQDAAAAASVPSVASAVDESAPSPVSQSTTASA